MAAQQKNNSNTFIQVEQWGAQNEPRVMLPERPFVHGCLASEKVGDIHYIDFYTRRNLTNDVGKCLCNTTQAETMPMIYIQNVIPVVPPIIFTEAR